MTFQTNLSVRRLAAVLAATMFAIGPIATATASDAPVKLQSLRAADVPDADPQNDNPRNEKDRGPIQRDYVQQPPLIPHSTKGYAITKNFNKCLDCHSWSRYKETGATKVSLTHFKDRDGQESSNISPRRYFCVQCHVPQADTKPLVGNSFKPAMGLR